MNSAFQVRFRSAYLIWGFENVRFEITLDIFLKFDFEKKLMLTSTQQWEYSFSNDPWPLWPRHSFVACSQRLMSLRRHCQWQGQYLIP